ncbi:MAG TPA: hypothetical protein VFJ15_03500 [Oleiagrimonas sp.]|nr:hypothetical protein [Oleiagrimonas sp.]
MPVSYPSSHFADPRSSRAFRVGRIVLCVMLFGWCAWAQASISVKIDRLSRDGMTLQDLRLKLHNGSQGRLRMQLKAASVDMAALGWHHVGLTLDGTLARHGLRRWRFDGTLALSGAPGGLLSHSHVQFDLNAGANNVAIHVVQESVKIDAALPLDQLSHARIKLTHLPLRWLQGLLASAWSGKLTGGRLDGVVALDVGDDGLRSSGKLALSNAGFDSPGGKLAGQDLDATGRVTLDTTGENTVIDTDLELQNGQLLLGPLYTQLPGHDVHLSMRAVVERYGISLRRLHFTDPGTLHLAGTMVLGTDGSVRNIHLGQFGVELPNAYQRYGKAWLATLGFDNLRTKGHMGGSLWMDSHGLRAFRINAEQVAVRGARIALSGLDGQLDWQRDGTRPASMLSWDGIGFYDIHLGAARSRWQSRDGTLTLVSPLNVPVLGGHLHVRQLAIDPNAGDGEHVRTALALTGIDVSRLCAALGWPEFTGTLGGAIPGLRYVGDHVELDGGLSLSVFGGTVDVTRLAVRHPFGDVPVLSGDIHLDNLNLANLTGVFDFGKITGRLDGSIDNLRLVNWKPVAFDASLATTGDGGRISQRAVNNLTSVGGGGMASGLQGAVLKLFDSFGYDRIGLSCKLKGSVCYMSGLEPKGDGYLIVDGSGLPHLSVIGHQHKVSWPTLVSRLKAAINSGGPVVD